MTKPYSKLKYLNNIYPKYKPKNEHAINRIETWKCSICGNDVHYLSNNGNIRRPGSSLTHDCRHVELLQNPTNE